MLEHVLSTHLTSFPPHTYPEHYLIHLVQEMSLYLEVFCNVLRVELLKFPLHTFLEFLLVLFLLPSFILVNNIRGYILDRFPGILGVGVASPFDLVQYGSLNPLLTDNVVNLVLSTYLCHQSILTKMPEGEQFEDCFQVELAISKVQQILFMNSNTMLLLHIPNQYTVVRVVDRYSLQILKHGQLRIPILEDVYLYDHKSIMFVFQNELHMFDLFKEESTAKYQIVKSNIYEEQFKLKLAPTFHQKAVFYKSSMLKSTPPTIYYDVHLLSITPFKLEHLKKVKVEHQEFRQFGFCSEQLFSYETTGFTIEICFIQSGISHKINSIFRLYLVDINILSQEIILNFTHQQLQHQVTSYSVTKKKVKKLEKKTHHFDPHIYYNSSKSRSIVYKNCFNHSRRDHFSGIFRVKATKKAKYLTLLDRIVPEQGGKGFKQEVLNLLQ